MNIATQRLTEQPLLLSQRGPGNKDTDGAVSAETLRQRRAQAAPGDRVGQSLRPEKAGDSVIISSDALARYKEAKETLSELTLDKNGFAEALGVGGSEGGEDASMAVIEEIKELLKQAQERLREAQQRLSQASEEAKRAETDEARMAADLKMQAAQTEVSAARSEVQELSSRLLDALEGKNGR